MKKYRYTRSTTSKPEATKTVVRYQHTEYLGKLKGTEEEQGTSADTTQYSSNPYQKLSVLFRTTQILPKSEIDFEKLVVNVHIEITQESVNAPSGFRSAFKSFIIYPQNSS